MTHDRDMHERQRTHPGPGSAPDRDILLSRLIDAEASAADWAEFKRLASTDQTIWAELSEAQRAHDELAGAVRAETAIADDIPAPIEAGLAAGLTERLGMLWSYGGWAAAAALLLTLVVGNRAGLIGGPGGPGDLQAAGLGPALVTAESEPDAALDAYLQLGKRAGTVLGVAPELVVLESRPAETGEGYDVVFLRQVIERKRVDSLYEIGRDDAGNPFPVRIEPERLRRGAL